MLRGGVEQFKHLPARPRPRDQLDIAEDLGLDIEILEPSSEDRHPRSSDVHVVESRGANVCGATDPLEPGCARNRL